MSESKKGQSLAFAYTSKRKGHSKSSTATPEPKKETAQPVPVSKDEATEAESPKKRSKIEPLKHGKIAKGASFSIKRRDEMDEEERQKLADGGMVGDATPDGRPRSATWEEEDHKGYHQLDAGGGDDQDDSVQMAAEGGMIGDEDLAEHFSSIAEAIRARSASGRSDLVANDEEMNEDDTGYDEQNEMAALKENYEYAEVSEHDRDDEDGDMHEDESENKLDRVSAIRRKMKK